VKTLSTSSLLSFPQRVPRHSLISWTWTKKAQKIPKHNPETAEQTATSLGCVDGTVL